MDYIIPIAAGISIFVIVFLLTRKESNPVNKCPYWFEINLDKDGTYTAYVWGKSVMGQIEIVHNLHRATKEEAEAFIEERAAFLDQTEYTVKKKLSSV